MQFIEGGPHIPDELIEELEEGNVVIFAGAGVSKNIGLPLFYELVDQVYEELNQPKGDDEKEESERHNYERVLGLLERKIGAKQKVREAVKSKLEIPVGTQLRLHAALMELARTQEGAYRLVTTNFDQGFVMADPSAHFESAPALPIPRKSSWSKPVHLHGLINAVGRTLNDLILTSADFGDAYIRSGWASRFVTELFSHFSILFLGYSVSDPVMRYLVDALAVSRSHGEHTHALYALVPTGLDEDAKIRRSWEAKDVNAITYQRDANHSRLVETIVEWAAIHKGGQASRLSVIARLAAYPPSPGERDGAASQMKWALSDKSGQAARKFADVNPPIGWLSLLEEGRLLSLPAKLEKGPDWAGIWLHPVNHRSAPLHYWLLNHLDKQELVDRAIQKNTILEHSFRGELHRKLWYAREPVDEPYRQFWRLLASTSVMNATVESSNRTLELTDRLREGDSGPLLLIEATDQLRPVATLKKPLLRRRLREEDALPEEVSDLVEFDLQLIAEHESREIADRLKNRCAADPALLTSTILRVSAHLERALTLFEAAGMASNLSDPGNFELDSLHNRPIAELHSWTTLVTLALDLILLTRNDTALAQATITLWLRVPYPIFLRLALFGMLETNAFGPSEACHLLLQLPARKFWHYSNEESTVPLVAKLCHVMDASDIEKLIGMVLTGPPRNLFRSDLSDDEVTEMSDRMRLRYLLAIESEGSPTTSAAQEAIAALRDKFPNIHLATPPTIVAEWERRVNEQVPDSDVEEYNELTSAEIAADIVRREHLDLPRAWATKYPSQAVDMLGMLTEANTLTAPAMEALTSGFRSLDATPQLFVSLIPTIPKGIQSSAGSSLVSLLDGASKEDPINPTFLAAWDSLADLVSDSPTLVSGEFFQKAFSSPLGQMTMMLLNRWLLTSPKRGSGIAPEIRSRLEALIEKPGAARAMAAAHLYALHFVDREWTQAMLIPFFDWSSSFALDVWKAYLFNPRWYPDLLADIKPWLLIAFGKTSELGKSAKNLFDMLGSILVYAPLSISDDEVAKGLQSLDIDGLALLTSSFVQIVRQQEVSERTAIWKRGVGRALKLWPLDRRLRDERLSENLSRIAILEENIFDEVYSCIEHLLGPIRRIGGILYKIVKSQLPEKYPVQLTRLLSAIVDPTVSQPFLLREASNLLTRVVSADSNVATLPEFSRLAKTGWFDL